MENEGKVKLITGPWLEALRYVFNSTSNDQ